MKPELRSSGNDAMPRRDHAVRTSSMKPELRSSGNDGAVVALEQRAQSSMKPELRSSGNVGGYAVGRLVELLNEA